MALYKSVEEACKKSWKCHKCGREPIVDTVLGRMRFCQGNLGHPCGLPMGETETCAVHCDVASVITVYWDMSTDAWAYRVTDPDGDVSRGTVCVSPDASIADAIDEACYQLDVELTHDDFAIDGLCADWAAEVPA